MKDWQMVYKTTILHRAEIVKDTLANHGILAVIVNKNDAAYQFGHLELHVNANDVLRSIKLIENDIQFE